MGKYSLISLIFEAAAVKRLERTGWQILGDNHESVGEHTFMTAIISYFLAGEVGVREQVNLEKVLIMSIFHDFHESRIGDLDKIATFYVKKDEDKANRDIFAGNPELLPILNEYQERKSIESRIVYEANILALLVELKILAEKGNINAGEWFDGNSIRLRLPEAIKTAEAIKKTNSQVWWKNIRIKLLSEFGK